MIDLLRPFFDGAYAPHGYCLLWQPALIWTHVAADTAIAAAYFSIPVALVTLVRQRRDIAFGWVFGLFALFILACGATHVMAIWTLWYGNYGVEAVIKVITAVASVATAVVLWPLLPRLVALPSPSALALANAGLNTMVVERDAAIAALQAQIDAREAAEAALAQAQKLDAVGQLTGGIAHDFNNLLQAVGGNLELVASRPGDALRVARWAGNALVAVDRGRRLTGQLLAFSRIQNLDLAPVAVAPLLAGIADTIERAIGPGTSLTITTPGAEVVVVADAMQLELALLNLAINARDGMAGGGTVRIAVAPAGEVAGLAPGDYVAISVSDTGTGMTPDVLARATEPFFTTKGIGKGTGLGLSMVFGVAAQSGGTVAIDSAPGAGTTVRLILRRTDAPDAAVAPVAAASPVSLAGRSIVLIDDDAQVRGPLAEALTAAGAEVRDTGDGRTGVSLVDARCPDIVVVDFAMPGMNGAEVAAAVRDDCPDMPVIVVTGFADTAALDAAVGDNVTILRKPFTTAELIAAVARLAPG